MVFPLRGFLKSAIKRKEVGSAGRAGTGGLRADKMGELVKTEYSKEMQLLLTLQYMQMMGSGMKLPSFDEVGFTVYSESDEDGILHFIFSVIGATNRRVVDIGSGEVGGSNTANLILNHGWTGLLIDGESARIEKAKKFYSECRQTRNYPPRLVSSWVTRDNINGLLRDNGFTGEVDLLNMDIDGIDYWIWKAIDCISPRVVLVEYQCIWGPERSVTVPYDPKFKAGYVGRYGVYSGASLSAFVKLAKEKGYRLAGCQRYGYNAFFVRNDIAGEILREVEPAECFKHPFTAWAMEKFLPEIKDREWVEV